MGNIKRPYICITGVPEGEEKRERAENLFEEKQWLKLPQPGEGNSSKEDELNVKKMTHVKTHN